MQLVWNGAQYLILFFSAFMYFAFIIYNFRTTKKICSENILSTFPKMCVLNVLLMFRTSGFLTVKKNSVMQTITKPLRKNVQFFSIRKHFRNITIRNVLKQKVSSNK